MATQASRPSLRCVQPPEIEVADIVQKLLVRAITKICQDYVKFSSFVSISGNLKMNIDDNEFSIVSINEAIRHPPANPLGNRFDSRETLQPLTKTVSKDPQPTNRTSANLSSSSADNFSVPPNPLFNLSLDSHAAHDISVQNQLQSLINESRKYFEANDNAAPKNDSIHSNMNDIHQDPINLKTRDNETNLQATPASNTNDCSAPLDAGNSTTTESADLTQNSTEAVNNEREENIDEGDDAPILSDGGDLDDDEDDDIALADLINEVGSDSEAEDQDDDVPVRRKSRRKQTKGQYICAECPYTTSNTQEFKEHKKEHAKNKPQHSCNECSKKFSSASKLRTHMKRHRLNFHCSECKLDFKKKVELKKHFKEDHDIVGFSCEFCRGLYYHRSDLQTHVQDAHNHICSICGESFTRMADLHKHRTDSHCKEVLKCKICGQVCASKKLLRKHVKRHTDRSHVCDICGKVFTAQSTLYHHKRGVHSDDKPYKCKFCEKSFNFHHSLKLHILHHNGTRPHQCPHCSKSYLTATHLKSHVDAIHKPKKYTCETCGKSFPYDSSLKMHMMLHKGERPFTCSICNHGFVSKSALKSHENSAHTFGKMFQCSICQKTYKTEGLLRAHERRHTDAGSRFMCDVCGHTFMYKSNLDAHIVTHGDERKYECNICNKTFKTNATLYSHQLVHKSDTPFRCCICAKEFKSKERLAAHEKRHSGLKPFSCDICQRSFPDKGGLTKHKKTVHSNYKRFACMICGKTCSRSDNLRVHMKTHGDASVMKADSLIKKLESPLEAAFVEATALQKNTSPKASKARSENVASMNNSTSSAGTSQMRSISDQNCPIMSEMPPLTVPLQQSNSIPASSSCAQNSMSNLPISATSTSNESVSNMSSALQMSSIGHHGQMTQFNHDRISLNQPQNLHSHNPHSLGPVSSDNTLPLNPVVLPLMNQGQNQGQQSGPEHDYVTAANSVLYMQYGPYFGNFPY